MRILFGIGAENPIMVKPVNAHAAAGVDDLLVVEQNAYVHDLTFFVIKKKQGHRPLLLPQSLRHDQAQPVGRHRVVICSH